jgi:hypothetical protein
MSGILEKSGVALAGFMTSMITAGIISIINYYTGFNVFTFGVFVIVPVGAAICGFFAASGYFFGAKYFHQRPSWFLLIQMLFIAAFTQFFTYWLEYKFLVIDGQYVSDFVPFFNYVDISLTSAHMSVGRTSIDTGEVGSFGYFLAFMDFVGFIAGGAYVYLVLGDQLSCQECNKYLKNIAKKTDSFENDYDFSLYFDHVYNHEAESEDFANHLRAKSSVRKPEKGTIKLLTKAYACPNCAQQSLRETIQVCDGRDWHSISSLTRWVNMPRSVDLKTIIG